MAVSVAPPFSHEQIRTGPCRFRSASELVRFESIQAINTSSSSRNSASPHGIPIAPSLAPLIIVQLRFLRQGSNLSCPLLLVWVVMSRWDRTGGIPLSVWNGLDNPFKQEQKPFDTRHQAGRQVFSAMISFETSLAALLCKSLLERSGTDNILPSHGFCSSMSC